MLKKLHEKKDEEDRQSLKQINACDAPVDNNINVWILREQATEKLKYMSVEKRPKSSNICLWRRDRKAL